jgi:hypothetical protein
LAHAVSAKYRTSAASAATCSFEVAYEIVMNLRRAVRNASRNWLEEQSDGSEIKDNEMRGGYLGELDSLLNKLLLEQVRILEESLRVAALRSTGLS